MPNIIVEEVVVDVVSSAENKPSPKSRRRKRTRLVKGIIDVQSPPRKQAKSCHSLLKSTTNALPPVPLEDSTTSTSPRPTDQIQSQSKGKDFLGLQRRSSSTCVNSAINGMTDKKHFGQIELVPWVRENFKIDSYVGEGSFGVVYRIKARHETASAEELALKCMLPTADPVYSAAEIRILRKLRSVAAKNNIMELKSAHRFEDRIFILMPFFEHCQFKDFLKDGTSCEILEYIRNLLIALRYLHEQRIIHRDVKPTNWLYDRMRKRYALTDFGLAKENVTNNHSFGIYDSLATSSSSALIHEQSCSRQLNLSQSGRDTFETEALLESSASVASRKQKRTRRVTCHCFGKPKTCRICKIRPTQKGDRAGTAGYKSPELLLKSHSQSSAIDIWSAGMILFALLAKRAAIMRPKDDDCALAQLAVLFGSAQLTDLATKLRMKLTVSFDAPGLSLPRLCRFLQNGATVKPAQTLCHRCVKFCCVVRRTAVARCFTNQGKTSVAERLCFCLDAAAEEGEEEEGKTASLLFRMLEKMLQLEPASRASAGYLLDAYFDSHD